MSSTGDAADLFGTSDGSNDPFGSAVDSVADTPDDLFGAQSASDASDPFAQHAAEQDDWLAQDSGGYAAANNYQNQQPHTVSQAPASPYQAAQQSYASQPRNGYNAGSNTYAQGAYTQPKQQQQQHNSYAPPVKSTPSYSAYTPAATPSSLNAATASSQAYSPAVAAAPPAIASTPSAGPYNPYTPAAPVVAPKMTSQSSYGFPQYSYAAAVPEPPKPAPAPYRPKTANAYDPPVPAVSKRRAPPSRVVSQAIPPAGLPAVTSPYGLPPAGTPGSPAFPAYGLPQQPVLPPPPPSRPSSAATTKYKLPDAPPPPPSAPFAPPQRVASPYDPPTPASPYGSGGSLPPARSPPQSVPPVASPYGPPQGLPPRSVPPPPAPVHPPPRPTPSRRGTPLAMVAYGLGAPEDAGNEQATVAEVEDTHDGVPTNPSPQVAEDEQASAEPAEDDESPSAAIDGPAVKLDPFWEDDENVGDETVTADMTSGDTSSASLRHESEDAVSEETETSEQDADLTNDGLATSSVSNVMPDSYKPVAPPTSNGPYNPPVNGFGGPPRRASTTSSDGYAAPKPPSPYNPYKPRADLPRTTSPGAMSLSSIAAGYQPPGPPPPSVASPYALPPVTSPYSPPTASPYAPPPRTSLDARPPPPLASSMYAPPARSFSEGVLAPPPPPPVNGSAYNPYAPTSHAKDPSGQSQYGVSPYAVPPPPVDQSQEVSLAPPTHAAYAPSPTLSGTNDPLGRVSGRAPIISMGFGGKIVTCFHGAGATGAGFDVALSSRYSTDIHIRTLHEIIPSSALDMSESSFPGPLFNDPGTPTAASLVRTGAAQTKAKKAKVVKYLEDRAEEISRGLGYLHGGSDKQQQMEAKLVITQLLKVLVEQDGRLLGNPAAEGAIRGILVPRITSAEDLTTMSAPGFSSLDLGGSSSEIPVASYSVRSSTLDKISDLLIRGERKQAYQYALDEKLWAHAMVIASSLDKDAWKEAVTEFVRTELGSAPSSQSSASVGSPTGREPLRVAYSFFAGQGAASLQQMMPPSLLLNAASQISLVPPSAHMSQQAAPKASSESLSKWAETAAMLLSSPTTPDSTSALVALGDHLNNNEWTTAAHVCYLLAGQPTLLGGFKSPAGRIVLLGGADPQTHVDFYRDQDAIIFSEVLEFALSLATPTKGQEPFHGLPHLQAYKLLRAAALAELGHVKLASRYCEAIAASVFRSSPYVHGAFAEQLKALADRLTGAPQIGKANSWIGSKVAKPTLNGIGSWLEGRLTNLIAGEGETEAKEPAAKAQQSSYGPFSHYSTITSTGPSTSTSPQPSVVNHNALSNAYEPAHGGRALAAPNPPRGPVDRASSAMAIRNRAASPVARTASVGPNIGSAHNGGYPTPYSPYGYSNAFGPSADSNAADAQDNGADKTQQPAPSADWWGGLSESTTATPMAPAFVSVDQPSLDDTSGFMSLATTPSFGPTTSSTHSRVASVVEEDEEDDLGFGNKKKPATTSSPTDAKASTAAAKSTPASEPEKNAGDKGASASGSWLGRWWKKESGSGPVKASLGEESSFYYDKELKRWVSKGAGSDAPKPAAPPPPPSRPQSVAPAPAAAALAPPPPRPASAMNTSTGPPIGLARKSSLVPTDLDSTPSTPPPGATLGAPPPPGRPKSQASKRNIRSRYVDVFQPAPDAS